MQAETDFNKLQLLLKGSSEKHFVLCDHNTYRHCYDLFCNQLGFTIEPIIIDAGESIKNLNTCEFVWQTLIHQHAGKGTILINLGGGVVSDIGGFAAATYKRGIKYVNVPTSLLAMVDAASGGKTGVNFKHYKNMIGLIQQAEMVLIHAPFLKTLPQNHIKNGFAEMLKHALLNGSEDLHQLMSETNFDYLITENAILKSLTIKETIVAQDPTEKGLRKVLNLGHTLGHAIEYAAQELDKEIFHGEAVALGLIAALKLSVIKIQFNRAMAETMIAFIRHHYETPNWLKSNHVIILNAVAQDKKNSHQQINMVLLKEIGQPVYDIACTVEEIEKVLAEI